MRCRFFGRLADEYRYASTPPPMLLTHPYQKTESPILVPVLAAIRHLNWLHHWITIWQELIVARYAGINNDAALDWFERQLKKAPKAIVPSLEYLAQALVYLDSKNWIKQSRF